MNNIFKSKNYDNILENAFSSPYNDTFYLDTRYVDEETVEYEIIFGNEKIVFIKAGVGGTARGYEDKYLKMARRVHEQIGATVICASNPDVPHGEIDEAEIRWVIAEKGFSNYTVSFIGTSDGAYQNLLLSKRFPKVVKWLGINSSYININSFKKILLSLPDVNKILIYGTRDDDFDKVVPAISEIVSDNLVMKLVENADHSFTGMTDEFIALADYLCK